MAKWSRCREDVKRASARSTSCSTLYWHFEAAVRLKCDRPGGGRVNWKRLVKKRCANSDIPLNLIVGIDEASDVFGHCWLIDHLM